MNYEFMSIKKWNTWNTQEFRNWGKEGSNKSRRRSRNGGVMRESVALNGLSAAKEVFKERDDLGKG